MKFLSIILYKKQLLINLAHIIGIYQMEDGRILIKSNDNEKNTVTVDNGGCTTLEEFVKKHMVEF